MTRRWLLATSSWIAAVAALIGAVQLRAAHPRAATALAVGGGLCVAAGLALTTLRRRAESRTVQVRGDRIGPDAVLGFGQETQLPSVEREPEPAPHR